MPSALEMAKEYCLRLVDDFEAGQGVGPDQYWDQPIYHPMAEAKHLCAISALAAAGVISGASYEKRVRAALSRLEAANLSKNPDEACWGLGFAWGPCPADEPYVITTAQIAEGLLSCPAALGTQPLLDASLKWLGSDERLMTIDANRAGAQAAPFKAPAYSKNTQKAILNAIAVWAGVMHAAADALQRPELAPPSAVFDWLWDSYIDPVGWVYEPGSARIDLLHQCYILLGLASARADARFESAAFRALSHFHQHDGILDKFDLVDEAEAVEALKRSSRITASSLGGERWIIRHPQPAKMWSMGELLSAYAFLTKRSVNPAFWEAQLRRTLAAALAAFANNKDAPSQAFGRDAMHLANGVAKTIDALKDRNRRAQATPDA